MTNLKQKKTELLIPVGSPEKLLAAIEYGADAVYLGGQKYGLRYASENFNYDELEWATRLCHSRNVKIFVVINSYFHEDDFNDFLQYVVFLNKIKIDALIVSDLGVIKYLASNSSIPIHLSTQASCLNVESAKFWKKQGVSRIVLGREVSIIEASQIKKEVQIEVEMFIHGSMCMSYSGQCTISNYTQGRDSNRGGCAHSCRFDYKLHDEQQSLNNFFMSSKDLNGIEFLPHFIDCEIDSLKIEGRMKTVHYVGTVAKVYKEAINYLINNGDRDWKNELQKYSSELTKLGHRDYFSGSLNQAKLINHTFQNRENIENDCQVVGEVIDIIKNKQIIIHCSHKFRRNDRLEIMSFSGKNSVYDLLELKDALNIDLESTRPGQIIRIPYLKNINIKNLVRKIKI